MKKKFTLAFIACALLAASLSVLAFGSNKSSMAQNNDRERQEISRSYWGYGEQQFNAGVLQFAPNKSFSALEMQDMVNTTSNGAGRANCVGALMLYGKSDAESINALNIVIPQEHLEIIVDGASNSLIYQLGLYYPLGSVLFTSPEAINQLNAEGDYVLTMKKLNPATLSGEAAKLDVRMAIQVDMTINGQPLKLLKDQLLLQIPFVKAADEDSEKLCVFNVGTDGTLTPIRNSAYVTNRNQLDVGETTGMQFLTNNTGVFVIAHVENAFTDVSGWYESYADFIAARDLMPMVSDKVFAANTYITRSEFAHILANLSNYELPVPSNTVFSDVNHDDKYATAIYWAYSSGVINGFEDGTFRPGANITRQELAAMLCRYVDLIANTHLPMTVAKIAYNDDDKIAAFAKSSVDYLSEAGVLAGKGNNYFAPLANTTRAECAKMIAVISQSIKEGKASFVDAK